ncbi:hypothetical protein [Bacillus sp. RS11]|uniref:hypothetical protein n=1 Tax=Lysinibacillus sp. RS11 TaxID=3242682 RepID=UPI0035C6E9AE
MNNEKDIITQIVLNHRNHYVYGDEHYFNEFKKWMLRLQEFKGFKTIHEAMLITKLEKGRLLHE